MKKLAHSIIILLTLVFLAHMISVTSAQALLPKPSTLTGPNETQQQAYQAQGGGGYGVQVVIPFVAQMFIGFTASVSFIALLYGGIRYVTAFGNETATGDAKKVITWSLVGLVIAIMSYAIVSVILKFKIG